MRFGMLGPLEVIGEGGPLRLGGLRRRAVLARLLLDAGHVVGTDRLVEDVWDARPPATAHKTLQKYVSELRRVLGPGAVRTTGGGYVLDVDDDNLDARRFEQLLGNGDPAAALALWRGEFLADMHGIAFAEPERARLEELRLVARERLIEGELGRGNHDAVVGELAELALAHPLRERLSALHMLALYRSGRQAEALRVFDDHRKRLAEDLGLDPAPGLRDLEAAILRQEPELDLPLPAGPRTGALPVPLTSFVGRRDDLDATEAAVLEHRMVTLTGPGGVGKTRLALELAARLADRYPGGVSLVELAAVQSPDLVTSTVASALGIESRDGQDQLGSLVSGLAHRPACVVLMDNCEHVVDACAPLLARVLQACPDVRVLATSRQPVGVDGEYVRPVRPLPDDEAELLFADRARHLGLPTDAAGATDTAAICRRLDGLPLAIELAASQLRVLAPAELVARLHDQLHFRGRTRTAATRQQTLHDLVAWSNDLLAPDTQRVFARLGVFAASFTLDAAEAVCGDAEVAARDVLGHITTLVDHSLVVREPGPPSGSRYRLLETLRLFALERLVDTGAEATTRRAHAGYYRGLGQNSGWHLNGPDEKAWQARLELEEPNMASALTWTGEHDPAMAMRLAVALGPYWDSRWGDRRAVDLLETLIRRTDGEIPAHLGAWGRMVASDLAAYSGEARRAVPWATEAVRRFRSLGNERGLAPALVALGFALANAGAVHDADAAVGEGLRIARHRGDAIVVVRGLTVASYVAMRLGDHEATAELSREALVRWTGLGSRRGQAAALGNLAVAALNRAELDEADDLCRRALVLWQIVGDRVGVAYVRMTLGDTARLRGDLAAAEGLYDRARTDLQRVGDRRGTASAHRNLATIAARHGDLGRSTEHLCTSLLLRHDLGDTVGIAECLEALAEIARTQAGHERSVVLLAAADDLREPAGPAVRELLDDGRARLGPDRFEAAWRRARGMSVEELVGYARVGC